MLIKNNRRGFFKVLGTATGIAAAGLSTKPIKTLPVVPKDTIIYPKFTGYTCSQVIFYSSPCIYPPNHTGHEKS